LIIEHALENLKAEVVTAKCKPEQVKHNFELAKTEVTAAIFKYSPAVFTQEVSHLLFGKMSIMGIFFCLKKYKNLIWDFEKN
jgi:hypothetical protein